MRRSALALALALVGSTVAVAQSPADTLDQSLARLVESYTGLYTRESLPHWRQLFLPDFVSASTTASGGVSSRTLDEFYAAQARGFAAARRMGERLENVRTTRTGRLASIHADFVYWNDDATNRGRLVLTAIRQHQGWRFHSLLFSYHN